MSNKDVIAALGITKGTLLKFQVKGRLCSGIYPVAGEGYVEGFVRNGILVKTLKGYRVTIHNFDLVCKDVIVSVVS